MPDRELSGLSVSQTVCRGRSALPSSSHAHSRPSRAPQPRRPARTPAVATGAHRHRSLTRKLSPLPSTARNTTEAASRRLGHSARGAGAGSDPEPGLAQEPELF